MRAESGVVNKFGVWLRTEPTQKYYDVHGAQSPDHVNGTDWFAMLGWWVSFENYEFCIVLGPCLPKSVQLALPKLSQHKTEAMATHVAMLVKKQVATSTMVTIKCPYLGCPATLVVPKNLSARMQTLWCWHNSCPGKDGCGRPLEFVQSIPAAGTPTDGFFTIGHFTEVNYVETVPAPARTFSSEAECLHCQALAHGGGPKCKHTCMKRALTPDDSVQWPMHPFGTFVIKTDESSHPFNASIVSDSMRELLVDGVFWSHQLDNRPLKFYYHDSQQENFEAPVRPTFSKFSSILNYTV
jgi:hypothetical protein